MPAAPDAFLPAPRSIRRAPRGALASANGLDMAVAFVGKDWSDILGDFKGRTRLVCWLSCTNTNPCAIEEMMRRRSFRVRQVDAMHAKVYLPRGAPAVALVGSANLSTSALADEEASGQFETAMLVRRPRTVSDISDWFEQLWKADARAVTPADLRAAKVSWDAARRTRGRRRGGGPRPATFTGLPPDWKPSAELTRLAGRIRAEAPHAHGDVVERRRFFSALAPARLTRQDLDEGIRLIAGWTGHIGAFRPALKVPLQKVRSVFEYAFDESVDLVERLEQLAPGGLFKLDGFGINAWTLLLCWRNAKDCVPLNAVTLKFLKAFGLKRLVGASITPAAYRRWRSLARDLQQHLRLPTLAHVDLMAWRFKPKTRTTHEGASR